MDQLLHEQRASEAKPVMDKAIERRKLLDEVLYMILTSGLEQQKRQVIE